MKSIAEELGLDEEDLKSYLCLPDTDATDDTADPIRLLLTPRENMFYFQLLGLISKYRQGSEPIRLFALLSQMIGVMQNEPALREMDRDFMRKTIDYNLNEGTKVVNSAMRIANNLRRYGGGQQGN